MKYVMVLNESVPLNGRVYVQGEIAPDPTFGMINAAKECKDDIVCFTDGRPFFQILSEKAAKEADADKKNPAHIALKPLLTSFGTVNLGYKGPSPSIYTPEGAKRAGLKDVPVHPRDARAKEDAKARKAAQKKAQAEAEAKAKAKEKAAKEKAKATKKKGKK